VPRKNFYAVKKPPTGVGSKPQQTSASAAREFVLKNGYAESDREKSLGNVGDVPALQRYANKTSKSTSLYTVD
jgi:hypothetical protein